MIIPTPLPHEITLSELLLAEVLLVLEFGCRARYLLPVAYYTRLPLQCADKRVRDENSSLSTA
jgi:hypothetical protein